MILKAKNLCTILYPLCILRGRGLEFTLEFGFRSLVMETFLAINNERRGRERLLNSPLGGVVDGRNNLTSSFGIRGAAGDGGGEGEEKVKEPVRLVPRYSKIVKGKVVEGF